MKVFVDTAAWIALANADDELHPRANQIMSDLLTQKARLITTEFVLLEVADALAAPNLRSTTIQFINRLRQAPILGIIPLGEDLLADSLSISIWFCTGSKAIRSKMRLASLIGANALVRNRKISLHTSGAITSGSSKGVGGRV